MSLQEQGFRFCGHPVSKQAQWIHPGDLQRFPGWVDLTDVPEDELMDFFDTDVHPTPLPDEAMAGEQEID